MNINLNGAFNCAAILHNIQPVAGRILELVSMIVPIGNMNYSLPLLASFVGVPKTIS